MRKRTTISPCDILLANSEFQRCLYFVVDPIDKRFYVPKPLQGVVCCMCLCRDHQINATTKMGSSGKERFVERQRKKKVASLKKEMKKGTNDFISLDLLSIYGNCGRITLESTIVETTKVICKCGLRILPEEEVKKYVVFFLSTSKIILLPPKK
ncbi:hypothetical protein ILUMI_25364 [Ignelater luminosus]|uniref:Uncharacterized protein n=1 Tax=Ignelater luminosus TaxID=2038154 RepID=A0A8K0CAP3_IGNLU|nr:hypothetical protein ILUMI_25364 [Ignelater luminosus]